MSFDQRFYVAAVDMLRRMGATEIEIRHDDPAEYDPVAWVVMVTLDPRVGERLGRGAVELHECAASTNPTTAIYRLLEQMMDGGQCRHCGRPSSVERDWAAPSLAPSLICTYQYDPELGTFRRACEGDTK